MTTFFDVLNRSHPMAAARIVRREKFAWPGGYAMALVVNDGECLCPKCVAENFAQISFAHRQKQNDGWRPVGYEIMEGGETETCAHCGNEIA